MGVRVPSPACRRTSRSGPVRAVPGGALPCRRIVRATLYLPCRRSYLSRLDRKGPPQVPEGILAPQPEARGGAPNTGVSREMLGGVPKRSNGADCKSAGNAFGGSNPPPTTGRIALPTCEMRIPAGVAQLARASAFQAEGRGFEPRLPLVFRDAHVAQSVEHVLGKDEVGGSSPLVGLMLSSLENIKKDRRSTRNV